MSGLLLLFLLSLLQSIPLTTANEQTQTGVKEGELVLLFYYHVVIAGGSDGPW